MEKIKMMARKKNLAVITARGGSKRFHKKI